MKIAGNGIKRMAEKCRSLRRDESGTTAIEYALIGALVVLAIFSSVTLFASSTSNMYEYFTTLVNNAIG